MQKKRKKVMAIQSLFQSLNHYISLIFLPNCLNLIHVPHQYIVMNQH